VYWKPLLRQDSIWIIDILALTLLLSITIIITCIIILLILILILIIFIIVILGSNPSLNQGTDREAGNVDVITLIVNTSVN
jgi:type IV secretory pathway TrbL component